MKYNQEVDKLKNSELEDHILVAKRLSKTYDCTQGRKKALQNFSIKLSKDKIFGLLGPNGAGKTTFLQIVTGQIRQDSGKAWICGRDILDRKENDTSIGFCP